MATESLQNISTARELHFNDHKNIYLEKNKTATDNNKCKDADVNTLLH